jgi:hypothetical protein
MYVPPYFIAEQIKAMMPTPCEVVRGADIEGPYCRVIVAVQNEWAAHSCPTIYDGVRIIIEVVDP